MLSWQAELRQAAQEVFQILCERGGQYGDPAVAFEQYAQIFSGVSGRVYSPEQVAMLLAGLKLGRLSFDPRHRDSWLDLAGYALIGVVLASREQG